MSKTYKLSEVEAITGINLNTLKTDSKRGDLPTELIYEGKKPYKVITAETLANLLQKKDSGGYQELKEQWRREMLAGTHSGSSMPVSESYLSNLEWSFRKFWSANGGKESIEALNAESLRRAFAQFEFDEVARRDYYSSKMQMYKALSSFTKFLIRKGYKPQSAFEEIQKLRPKARIKPKRHSLELTEVWDAIHFNEHWNDGRTRLDIQITDLLLFLYGFTGIRRMEAANLKIAGVNFNTNEILVPGKWGKDRLVPIPNELVDKLREWIENLRPTSPLPYLIVNHLGNQLTDRSIACRFSRLSKALAFHKALMIVKQRQSDSGMPINMDEQFFDDEFEVHFPSRSKELLLAEAEEVAKTLNCVVRPHDLRRAYAKMLADQGMPLPRIQYVLGHGDIETTMKYINIKQKEASQWVHENFVITLPEKVKPQDEGIKLPAAKRPVTVSKPERKKKFRY